MRIAFEEPAIERPTGSMWGRLLGVVGWIGSTRLTVTPSKTFTSIRYSAMQDNGSAPIPPGKSIRKLSCRVKLLMASVKARELVPRQPVIEFGPANETSGNEDAASPEGSPFTPALFIQSPSMVAL